MLKRQQDGFRVTIPAKRERVVQTCVRLKLNIVSAGLYMGPSEVSILEPFVVTRALYRRGAKAAFAKVIARTIACAIQSKLGAGG